MNIITQIQLYIETLSDPKRTDMIELHRIITELIPHSKLWFLDGKNKEGKIVSNPNIGYGCRFIRYADGSSKEFYQIGLSANTTGISVYIMGIDDKTYLSSNFGKHIGKATVTGYCIKFKRLGDIHVDILKQAILNGILYKNENNFN